MWEDNDYTRSRSTCKQNIYGETTRENSVYVNFLDGIMENRRKTLENEREEEEGRGSR